jgi:hypothetical protein
VPICNRARLGHRLPDAPVPDVERGPCRGSLPGRSVSNKIVSNLLLIIEGKALDGTKNVMPERVQHTLYPSLRPQLSLRESRGVPCKSRLCWSTAIGLGTFEGLGGEMIIVDGHFK